MTEYAESGVRLILDTSDFDSGIDDVMGKIDELTSAEATVTVSADMTEVDDALAGIDSEDPEINARVSTDADSDNTLARIHDIVDIGAHAWNMIVNIAGTAVDFFGKINDFAVKPLLDLDQAVATFNAHTAYALPNARELFSNILYDDLGTDITQVEAVAEAAAQMNDPIEEATRAALTFTHVFTDQDPVQTLNALDAMVKNGLAPDFKSASDDLVVAFQNGANKGGDLLSTIQQNAGAIKGLGMTGPEALQLITNELDNGAASANQVIMSLETIKKNITAQTTGGKGPALDVLRALHIPNPITSGQGWSDDFFKSVADAIKNAPVSEEKKQQWTQALMGGKLGQKDYEAFLNMDAAQGTFDNIAGRGEQAAQTIDDSLQGAINDFVLAAQQAATDFLSSDQIDLPGKIKALKQGIQDGLRTLQGGGTLGEALTVALKPVGLDETFKRLEDGLTQFIISILQVIAEIQDLTGHGKEAAGTRQTISSMASEKLKLDLELTNGSFKDAFVNAVTNGIDPQGLKDAITNAVKESLATGDIAKAQKIVTQGYGADTELGRALQPLIDSAKALAEGAAHPVSSTMVDVTGEQSKSQEDLTTTTQAATTAITDQNTAVAEQTTNTQTLAEKIYDAGTAIQEQTDATTNLNNQTQPATQAIQKQADANADLTMHTDPAAGSIQLLGDNTDTLYTSSIATAGSIMNLNGAIQQLGQTAANANPAGGAVNPDHKAGAQAGGGIFSGLSWVGERGPELISSDSRMAVLNNRTAKGLMQALSGMPFIASGGYMGGGNKSVALYQTNIVNNPATADALSFKTAQLVRGMA